MMYLLNKWPVKHIHTSTLCYWVNIIPQFIQYYLKKTYCLVLNCVLYHHFLMRTQTRCITWVYGWQ